ncbi:uncharacterized protein HMPREF1541_09147 [Cyphellophora europaea CBS 101466]|uniref:Phosphatidic acid phosphatase type 2/haloperoxidase domain-containing protein n=1 Tax=Cyphellophora europaea (strain CBS 101466) TaxID=1220924 RepID=W2S9B6_CYPE1|nr:uncharacterized protein HMPREF1541_09147 [Cyphellophora europaea CBS 101466]ETN45316.1 hypothetical protein HMPREF1541_09147 [Cyphellophora europaea CBS 101466]
MALNTLTTSARRFSKRVLWSYFGDWIVMAVILGLAIGFHNIDGAGSRHAFALQDPSISYPHTEDLISNPVLYVTSVVIPGVLIASICLVFVPGITATRSMAAGPLWQRKLWEVHAAWLGLALACLSAIAITNGLKPLAGRPRPHLLAVCDPDLSTEAIDRWRVGGLGTDLNSAVPIVVSWHICRNTDASEMRNAFASFPSGHASTSWSGLLYLSLFLCAKFGIKIPVLRVPAISSQSRVPTPRNQGAAPPAYLILLAFVPIGVAFFISVSRWFDYRHHGFDIISGAILGVFTAWISFHLYQEPISTGDGWAWASRSRRHAFGLPVGSTSDAEDNVWDESSPSRSKDGPSTDVESNPRQSPERFEMNRGRQGWPQGNQSAPAEV